MKSIYRIIALPYIFFYISCNGQPSDLDKKIASFQQQQHRFEFREHQLFYNDTEVLLDQPLSYYENIFGKDYELKHYDERVEYNTIPIRLKKGMDSIVDDIRLYIYYLDQNMVIDSQQRYKSHRSGSIFYNAILDEQFILIDGIPINKNTNLAKELNPILIKKDLPTFNRGLAGTTALKRQYFDENYNYTIYIYIEKGNFGFDNPNTPLSYISYADASKIAK